MNRQSPVRLTIAVFALLAGLTHAAVVHGATVDLTKTVGTVPNECATSNFLAEVPPDGIVYYCYQMTFTGAVTASVHTVIDSALGNVIHKIPGGRCCTDETAASCEDPATPCNTNGRCSGQMPYTTCAETTYPGVCCSNVAGQETDCPIPHMPCEDDAQCFMNQRCVINPIVGPGQTVTRVITATVPPGGIANVATWTAESGICCEDNPPSCQGSFSPLFCDGNEDCLFGGTCRTEGIGRCCSASDPTMCNRVCLVGRECMDPAFPMFTECVPQDTAAASDTAGARVAVFSDTPVMSAGAMGLIVLALVGFSFSRLREHQS